MGIDEAATEAKRQLDEATMEDTMSGGHPEHRVLTTGLIGSGGARMSTSGEANQ